MKLEWRKFNDSIAIIATKSFGSMTAFWIFMIWSVLPYVPFLSGAKDAILYVSAGIVQLVALPLLMVGQNLSGAQAEIRAAADHEMILQEFEILKNLQRENAELTLALADVIKRLPICGIVAAPASETA